MLDWAGWPGGVHRLLEISGCTELQVAYSAPVQIWSQMGMDAVSDLDLVTIHGQRIWSRVMVEQVDSVHKMGLMDLVAAAVQWWLWWLQRWMSVLVVVQ